MSQPQEQAPLPGPRLRLVNLIVPVSPKARRLAQFIDSYTRLNGVAPTHHEMRRHFGYRNQNSIRYLLRQLDAAGVITRQMVNKICAWRGMRVVPALRAGAER